MATREETYSHEPVFTRVLTRAYTLNWEMVAYAIILVLAVLTRFIDLGARVMSHDESLHTYYSWRLYEFGEFQHTPLMHGPVLFHMVALSYFLFGDNDYTARLYPAILGVLIVLFPLLFRRWLGRLGAVIASVLLLISPMMMYYNRYIREDTPSIFYTILFLYAALQYADGERPRRPVWLYVMSGALLLSLASKEVAFMYVAIFGSLLALFWIMRIIQDVGIRRPAETVGGEVPILQLLVGHGFLFGIVGVTAFVLGAFLRYMLSPVLWMPSGVWIQAPLFVLMYVPLAVFGLIRNLGTSPGQPHKMGIAEAIMAGLSHGRSALYVILAGAIIGAILALVIISVVDVIKPNTVWTTPTIMSEYDQMYGPNGTKEFAAAVEFDDTMFIRLLTWVGIPILLTLFVLFISAVFNFPGRLPLPWREILVIILVAFLVCSVLVVFERRSFVEESDTAPFAATLNTNGETENGQYNNLPIVLSWVLGGLIVIAVVISRLLTPLWEFLNRQPLFDVLIVIGTLILPWLAAFPLYWAGYDLEEYNETTQAGQDTLRMALVTFIPFAMVSISLGLAWNWKRWVPAALVFITLFTFFFTTVFSNPPGLATGMVGSLGYWLEQQEVRRGSQPQYYYILTQLPVYEFLPMLGSLCAGITGLAGLWRWRRERAEADEAKRQSAALEEAVLDDYEVVDEPMSEPPPLEALELSADDAPYPGYSVVRYEGVSPRLTRPFDEQEEAEHRADDPEWIGSLPFLGLVGYWAVMIILALTIAGEKMPWLTTHMTVPLTLLAGWWFGRMIGGLRRESLRDGGWLILVIVMPLALVAMVQVLVPVWSGGLAFDRSAGSLFTITNWLAALLIWLVCLYVIGRVGLKMGVGQLGRVAVIAAGAILALLTARAAVLASFVNYDYATEFLVYAHSGPAVKTVLSEVDRIATLTNEGHNMRIVFDDESSWPYTWYFRHYTNYGFIRGEAGSVEPSSLDGARVVVVGSKKAGDVRRILGDRYYEFGYIRLWWPMQEYFNLNYDRVANVFSLDSDNIAAKYYRKGMFDMWLNRTYQTYGQAMCIEDKQTRCESEALMGETPEEREQFRQNCQTAVINECRSDQRFDVNNWPVSDRMYVFVDKQVAAEIWDAGIGSSTVDIREPEYPEDRVYRDISADVVLGEDLGMVGPRGIAIDDEGLIYVADTDHNRVVVMDQQGNLVRTIGADPGGTADPGALRQPWGLDIGPDGNLYVADTWNHRVQVFMLTGEFIRAWGHEGVPSQDVSTDAFWGPRELKVGLDGNVYVSDTGNKRIRVYTADGTFVRDIGSAGAALGQLDEPVGLAFNPISGNLYVAEAWNKRIQEFERGGLPLRTWDVNMWFRNRQSYNRPYIAVSNDGTLIYVTDMDDRHRIVAYSLDGTPVMAFNQPDNLESGTLGLRSPAGLAFDDRGRLYVVDAELARVFVFPPANVMGGVQPVPPVTEATDTVLDEPTEEPADIVTEEATEAAAG